MVEGTPRPGLNARAVYLIYCFAAALFFAAIFTVNLLYQVTVVGLDPLQLVLVGTALEATVFLCEIPTGVLADVKSRKLSVVIGTALTGAGFIVEGGLPFFAAVVAGQMLWGIGHTFTSGATQAWIADEIGAEGVARVYVRGAQMRQLGGFLGIPLGVGLGLGAVQVPIVAGGAGFVLLAFFCWIAMPEQGFTPARAQDRRTWAALAATLRRSGDLVRRQRVLVLMLAVAFCYGLYSEGIDRLWVPHLVEGIGLPEGAEPVLWFGLIAAVGKAVGLLGTVAVERLVDMERDRAVVRALMTCAGGMVAAIVGVALADGLWALLLALWVFGALRSASDPLDDAWFNRRIDDSRVRATMFSVASQMDAVGQFAGGPGVGAVGRWWSIRAALVCSALLLVPVLPLYAWAQRVADSEENGTGDL